MVAVSVVIPNYNYGRFLAQAVESVREQTLPVKEIIVVDDGSTDDSAEVLAGYGAQIKVIRQRNEGVGAARNCGVQAATGDLVAFLDADDYWLPQKLELQVQRFLAEPDLGLIHCGMQIVDVAGNPLAERLEGREGWLAENLLTLKPGVVTTSGSAVMIPRAVFESVGGFDPNRLLHPSEDWDLSYRIACRYKIGFVPEALVQYRQHGVNGHLNVRAMERAMMIAFAKAFSSSSAPALQRHRHHCYGKLHMVLAGSYFHTAQYADAVRHLLKSLWLTPGNVSYALRFPLRWLHRRGGGADAGGKWLG